jgi:hypothetical protein
MFRRTLPDASAKELVVMFTPLRAFFRSPLVVLGFAFLPAALAGACSSGKGNGSTNSGSNSTGNGGTGTGSNTGGGPVLNTGGSFTGGSDAAPCGLSCSTDHHSVVDCNGKTIVSCMTGQGCDLMTGGCADACQAAADNKQSVGCDYYATHLEMDYANQQCFAAFVANTWDTPAHLTVEFNPGVSLAPQLFARIPSGTGANITYTPYDPAAGLAPGQVAILFLSGSSNSPNVPCPPGLTTAAALGSAVQGTGVTHSFHITTDVPVVAYQINPYGGGSAAITGASLLLPTSVWDTNYIAVTAAPEVYIDAGPYQYNPSFNIVAAQDGTNVTLLPNAAIVGGMSLPAGPASMPYMFTLNKGQQAQFSQPADLTGTIVQSDKPVGFMAGNACMQVPLGTNFCDHGEQMLPPVKSLGNEYVGVMFRPRVTGDQAIWHMVGTVAGTQLTYVPAAPANAPATLGAGQVADFITDQPFVVKSQDTMHPFMLFTYMTGATDAMLSDKGGYGDPDFVVSVPPQQYLNDYIFFTDVTYPETNLVVVRAKDQYTKMFDDVTLDCLPAPSTLTGWQPVGDYEWTRVDLTRDDFANQGGCSTGRREMKSKGLFGLWVWGWGSPKTTINTKYVSYGYPGGMNVQPFNGVVIPPKTN